MSKAILILDMPNSCSDCSFFIRECINEYSEEFEDECEFSEKEITVSCLFSRPNWCPLKSVPEKLKDLESEMDVDTGYKCGWNECIDEIVKEK